jgi:hypothetical protein
MNDLWVVFDGTEPDSEVIGLATTLESALDVIGSTVSLNYQTVVIELPYSDVAVIRATAGELYGGSTGSTERAWLLRKRTITRRQA